MKKLMLALAVCAVCGMAQAASLTWKSLGDAVDGSGNQIGASGSDGKLVLVLLGTSTTGTWTGGYDAATVVQEGSWSVTSSKGSTSSKVTTTYYGGGTVDGNGSGTLAQYNVYAVMFQDASNNLYQLKDSSGNAIDTYYWRATAPAATDVFNFTFASGSVAATSAGYTAVPEPTSGILMLVGLGALALRRRRA